MLTIRNRGRVGDYIAYSSGTKGCAALQSVKASAAAPEHMSKDERGKNLVRAALRQYLRQLGGRCVPGALRNTTERARISIRAHRGIIEAMRRR